jgi:hypothetical protein
VAALQFIGLYLRRKQSHRTVQWLDYTDLKAIILGVVARIDVPLLLSGNDPLPLYANRYLHEPSSSVQNVTVEKNDERISEGFEAEN